MGRSVRWFHMEWHLFANIRNYKNITCRETGNIASNLCWQSFILDFIKKMWTCSKNTGRRLWTFQQSVTFLSSDLFLLLIGKVRYFLIKRWYKIVTVKILNLLLLFNRRYWALNTNKWSDKKVTQPNIQKW